MATKRKSTKTVDETYVEIGAAALAEAPSGCSECDNTGLDRKAGLDEAQVCPVCNGSPFGE